MPSSVPARDDDDNASPESSATSRPPADDKSIHDDGNHSSESSHTPATPHPTRPAGPKVTPKSAPAAAGYRARSTSKKPEPTLLTDFLRGRPSPARLAAERKRRESIEALKAEMRQEMRQSAVRKVQPPGGVRDRVQAWQKTNAAAMVAGDPDDAATEPPDVAFKDDDLPSVTEEDRIRIKMRQKKKPALKSPGMLHHPPPIPGPSRGTSPDMIRPNAPPKKRVVSDDNWRKIKGPRGSLRRTSPRARKSPTIKPTGLPADFVIRSGPNPTVSSKIKTWAAKVEAVEATPPRSMRSARSKTSISRSEGAVASEGGYTSSQATAKRAPPHYSLEDDGIRVTPLRGSSDQDGSTIDASGRTSPVTTGDGRIKTKSASRPKQRSRSAGRGANRATSEPRQTTSLDQIEVITESSVRHDNDSGRIHVIEEPESIASTPTRRPASRRRPKPSSKSPPTITASMLSEDPTSLGEGASYLGSVLTQDLEVTSSIAARSLADIPGDIPLGQSAFSELDLTLQKSRPKRVKTDRSASLKTMPNVFKKVMEEGKKIIHDMNEPPKQAVMNNPPSIEKWLNNTVDPFVEESSPKPPSPASDKHVYEPVAEQVNTGRRLSYEKKPSTRASPRTDPTKNPEEFSPRAESPSTASETTPTKAMKTSPSGVLKRRRAMKGPSAPRKPYFPILGALKEAFQGESSGHATRPMSYQGQEERISSRYDGGASSYHSSDYTSATGSRLTLSSADSGSRVEDNASRPAAHRPRPPTNGRQELSTILSEDDSSALGSDVTSEFTQSTLTQSTTVTKDSEPKHGQSTTLKRRLTRHSDLVSVLSLPDDSNMPSGIMDKRSRPSLRKSRGFVDVSADDLLREFNDDENLYLRHLKTLVDGVVPVLLSQVVHGSNVTELFEPASQESSSNTLSKSVVGMGVALEKLNNAHRKAPTSDLRRLAHWAHGTVPIYSNYLSAWRLGFEDVVVNLAPAAGKPEDEDSLLNALPRDENGDIIDAQGERVAVAHLLKRPLIRVKQLARLFQCIHDIVDSSDTRDLVQDFEALQDKARRRHKEETARRTDEDATNTDTSRARDLRTLNAPKLAIKIEPDRQVNAKDLFSLSLAHSNGQRLECQVELVHRDRQSHPGDKGDLLIRETGDVRRAYLLFAPISMSMASARRGDDEFEMVVMVRGTYGGKPWHELLTLMTDNEEQIQDWLEIFPSSPVPLTEPEASVVGPSTPERSTRDAPVGAPTHLSSSPQSPITNDVSTSSPDTSPLPSRYRPRATTSSPQPAAISPEREDLDKTPTQPRSEDRSRPLHEDMRPDPKVLWAGRTDAMFPPYDETPPPPPVHRSPSTSPMDKPPTHLSYLGEQQTGERLKRRGSSPLKHEYLPSDTSSTSGTYSTEESDSDSSDDDIDSVDIPETDLGVSIKHGGILGSESILTSSSCSLTPSNSASQAGLRSSTSAASESKSERFIASISRWSDKGAWKDMSAHPCSIVVTAGLIEAFAFRGSNSTKESKPLLALDLTPLVLIRQSTALDLEIRSTVQSHCVLHSTHGGGNFRFRCHNAPECFGLYMSVHHARLNNQKFIQLENEARFKSFGERKEPVEGEGSSSSRRRSWFGRRNSYRGSVRAPSQSQDGNSTTPSSTPSASSFLKKLTSAGNLSFNLARSTVDKQGRGSGGNSLYTLNSSSSGATPLRSPSISIAEGAYASSSMSPERVKIRLHLLVSAAKWEDYGNCTLQIRRPPPGWRQALRADHGLEKRVTATSVPKKEDGEPKVLLDAVLGSGCFSPMGSRGIVCGVWEEVRDGDGVVGMVPATGATGGNIKKWCFQLATAGEAGWVLRLLHQEVLRA
ncbi:hypothetical protein HIM_02922 [Hirsutella minnesotensis 3608]|nr:hypothetical protein HIM_02922 [Hirsutella minnesotensis 3608]